jgi:hypothetical protein
MNNTKTAEYITGIKSTRIVSDDLVAKTREEQDSILENCNPELLDKSEIRDFRALGLKFNAYEFANIAQGAKQLRIPKLTFVRFAGVLFNQLVKKMSPTERYHFNMRNPEFIFDLVDIQLKRKKTVKTKGQLRGIC